ncbi:hypothetical protein N9V72_00580 [Pseudomonadota bacterium]|nr:hypothetical protein [Pseudomonadota bacterium]
MNAYIIILLVVLFLVGSINLVIPTKKTRMLSHLRLLARKKGFQIASLTSKQKFVSKNLNFVCYSIKNMSNLKNAHYVLKESSLSLYDPIKLKFDDNFEEIENKISDLPDSILEIIFNDSYISFLWNENLGIDELEKIEKQLKNFSI